MAKVSALYVYPIKSCAGINVPEISLTLHGVKHDRQFVLVDKDGKFLSQRELPLRKGVVFGRNNQRRRYNRSGAIIRPLFYP